MHLAIQISQIELLGAKLKGIPFRAQQSMVLMKCAPQQCRRIASRNAYGYLLMLTEPMDKRQKIITLTDTAFEFEKRITDHVEDAEQRMAQGMTSEELDTIKRLLYKVYKNISKE